MAKSTEKIPFSSQRKTLLSHRLFAAEQDLTTIPIPSFPVLVPRDLRISFQHLRYSPTLPTLRMFSRHMILKLHLEGTSTGVVDGRTYIFKPGTAMLMFPFQPHWILHVGRDREVDKQERLLFVFDLSGEEQKMLLPLKDRILRLTRADYALMLDIVRHLQQGDPAEMAVCPYLLNQFLFSCLAGAAAHEPQTAAGSPAAQAVFDYIRRHYMENPTVAQMAEDLRIGRTKLRAVIRKELGVSPGMLIRSLRVKQAAELLSFTDRKIREISRECGFSNPFAFSRTFRREYAMSPSEFRKKSGGG